MFWDVYGQVCMLSIGQRMQQLDGPARSNTEVILIHVYKIAFPFYEPFFVHLASKFVKVIFKKSIVHWPF